MDTQGDTSEQRQFGERTALPRCQYGMPTTHSYAPETVEDCGEPAVARWEWPTGGPLYVCEEHDAFVEEHEEVA